MMKFLIDAQLPPSLKEVFTKRNYSCIHTLDLPKENDTTDTEIRNICHNEKYILISKDEDFYYTNMLNKSPEKLILIKTGNCSKSALKSIIDNKFDHIIQSIEEENIVVVTR